MLREKTLPQSLQRAQFLHLLMIFVLDLQHRGVALLSQHAL